MREFLTSPLALPVGIALISYAVGFVAGFRRAISGDQEWLQEKYERLAEETLRVESYAATLACRERALLDEREALYDKINEWSLALDERAARVLQTEKVSSDAGS